MSNSIVGTDTGGTFTDFVLIEEDKLIIHKVPSTPSDQSQAVADGLRAIPLLSDTVISHGSTVATNALLERKGAKTALIATDGFEDIIQIGRQARHELYALDYQAPEPLVPPDLRIGIAERIDASGAVIKKLEQGEIDRLLAILSDLNVEAISVSLLFSFLRPDHEEALKSALDLLEPRPFISLSSEVLPEFREFERTSTVTVNSYVGPLVSRYLGRMEGLIGRPLRVMQSSGGSVTADLARRQPVRTILSGPAGGVIGASYVANTAGYPHLITLDMGGTSTDVSLCPGQVQMTTTSNVGGSPVSVPMIDIQTVGAGGGSLARLDVGGALLVGPESAGAVPGPACYGTGEEATVTDANLILGRMASKHFLGGRMELDVARAEMALDRLANPMGVSRQEAALGIIKVANAVVERILRTVSLEKGHDPRDFVLIPFGGAGPQHGCELATALGIPKVLVPRYPGVLSALGVAVADVVKDYSRTVMVRDDNGLALVESAYDSMESQGLSEMGNEGFSKSSLQFRRWLDVRYRGQSFELPIEWATQKRITIAGIAEIFHSAHEQRFGYKDENGAVEIVNVRLSIIAPTNRPSLAQESLSDEPAEVDEEALVWFDDGPVPTKVYDREKLKAGQRFSGPSLIFQMDATTVVPIGWTVEIDTYRNLIMTPNE